MAIFRKVLYYCFRDILYSRWGVVNFIFFMGVTEALVLSSGNSQKIIVSLMSLSIYLVPLISIILGSMYYYSSREFIELLLTQPIKRSHVFAGIYMGLAAILSLCYLLGIMLPLLWHAKINADNLSTFLILFISGISLTFIFTGLAFWISAVYIDKSKGLGLTIIVWLMFSIVYDGLLLIGINAFGSYPLEKPVIAASVLNPIDLARLLLLMKIDMSALMGYTGAVYERFFGTNNGIIISLVSLTIWIILPAVIGMRKFIKKDF